MLFLLFLCEPVFFPSVPCVACLTGFETKEPVRAERPGGRLAEKLAGISGDVDCVGGGGAGMGHIWDQGLQGQNPKLGGKFCLGKNPKVARNFFPGQKTIRFSPFDAKRISDSGNKKSKLLSI